MGLKTTFTATFHFQFFTQMNIALLELAPHGHFVYVESIARIFAADPANTITIYIYVMPVRGEFEKRDIHLSEKLKVKNEKLKVKSEK